MLTSAVAMQASQMKVGNLESLSVLYEDNHLLVVDKSAGIATMGAEMGQLTVARQAASYLKQRYQKPGNVFVGVVSRIDRLVSGVLVLARTSKAAGRLSEQIRSRTIQKRYLAWVENEVNFDTGKTWSDVSHFVRKNESLQRMQVVQQTLPGAQEARLRMRAIVKTPGSTVLEVDLITGRKHQIRLQLAELEHPIIGDSKYGSHRKFAPGIALHCHSLTLSHPTTKQTLTFGSSPCKHWPSLPPQLSRSIAAFRENEGLGN